MKAVIMAGGEGTRLRPLTSNQPKPMLPMANIPMMEHVVNLLRTHGFEDIVVTVAFMANAIRTYFGDGSEFGVRMVYATESTPLGTAGSVRNAKDELDERFLVISGDVLTDIDLGAVVDFHDAHGGLATLALKAVENPLEFGIVITNEDGSIERFLEKPTWGQVFSDTINTGIYVLEPEIFDYIPEGQSVDFSGESFPAALADGKGLFGYVAEGYWEDVGTLEAYLSSHHDILDGKVQVDIDGFPLRPGVWVGKGAEIDPSVELVGPAVIGDNCVVGPGARLGAYCTLGRNVRIGDNAVVERSVVHDNTYLGSGVRVEGSVLGRGSTRRSAPASRSTRSRRSRPAPSSTRRSSGSRAGPARCSVGTACGGWPTSTSVRNWPCASRWPGPRRSRRAPRSPAPVTPAGPPVCSSGPSWSAATPPG
jgi:mannose-1-phosphate guanylyltransferase/phosphomannomutase